MSTSPGQIDPTNPVYSSVAKIGNPLPSIGFLYDPLLTGTYSNGILFTGGYRRAQTTDFATSLSVSGISVTGAVITNTPANPVPVSGTFTSTPVALQAVSGNVTLISPTIFAISGLVSSSGIPISNSPFVQSTGLPVSVSNFPASQVVSYAPASGVSSTGFVSTFVAKSTSGNFGGLDGFNSYTGTSGLYLQVWNGTFLGQGKLMHTIVLSPADNFFIDGLPQGVAFTSGVVVGTSTDPLLPLTGSASIFVNVTLM